MKIEKINENQIRCIIEREDLEEHKLQLAELISGSERVRELFRDLMEQAFYEVGFDAENIPLMIEALPFNGDSLVLIITKVSNPEELASRYANIPKLNLQMDPVEADAEDDIIEDTEEDILDAVLDASKQDFTFEDLVKNTEMEHIPFTDEQKQELLSSAMDIIAPFTKALAKAHETAMKNHTAQGASSEGSSNQDSNIATEKEPAKGSFNPFSKRFNHESKQKNQVSPLDLPQYYIFESLEVVTEYSLLVTPFYKGESVLYKDPSTNLFYLILERFNSDKDDFRRACHLATDYATTFLGSYTTPAYMKEHFTLILKEQALETLASL